MLKRDELKGPSCLMEAADDEPLFVLRANDPLAAGAVRQWSYHYETTKRRDQRGLLTERQKKKIQNALTIADHMDQWRAEHSLPQGAIVMNRRTKKTSLIMQHTHTAIAQADTAAAVDPCQTIEYEHKLIALQIAMDCMAERIQNLQP